IASAKHTRGTAKRGAAWRGASRSIEPQHHRISTHIGGRLRNFEAENLAGSRGCCLPACLPICLPACLPIYAPGLRPGYSLSAGCYRSFPEHSERAREREDVSSRRLLINIATTLALSQDDPVGEERMRTRKRSSRGHTGRCGFEFAVACQRAAC
ncbi:hypothetical protein ALC62_01228, partial [Cyphomyrmex costatus]